MSCCGERRRLAVLAAADEERAATAPRVTLAPAPTGGGDGPKAQRVLATYRGDGAVAMRGPVTGLTYVFESGVPLDIDSRDIAVLAATGRFVG